MGVVGRMTKVAMPKSRPRRRQGSPFRSGRLRQSPQEAQKAQEKWAGIPLCLLCLLRPSFQLSPLANLASACTKSRNSMN